mgnify:CR=1 FL=1
MTSSNEASESNNIFYEFNEIQKNSAKVTYEELLANVNSTVEQLPSDSDTEIGLMMSDYVAQELNYNENYTLKQLYRIAEYYDISKRKKKKTALIEEIVIFENQPENCEIVNRRATLWSYMEEIKQDKYLSKFLILE